MPFPAHWDSSAATKLPPKCFNFAWVLSWGLGDITQCWRPRSLERACKSSEPEIKSAEISFVKSQLQLYVKHEPLARVEVFLFTFSTVILPDFGLCVLIFLNIYFTVRSVWNNSHALSLFLFLGHRSPLHFLTGMELQRIAKGSPTWYVFKTNLRPAWGDGWRYMRYVQGT